MADGGGGGGGGGGKQGGIGGAQNGGDDGAFSGSDGLDLVPSGGAASSANNAGGRATAGADGYVQLVSGGLAISAATNVRVVNSGNGGILTISSITSQNNYFAVSDLVTDTVGYVFTPGNYHGYATQFTITPFTTLAPGTYQDTIIINSNSKFNPVYKIPVTINMLLSSGSVEFSTPGVVEWTVPPHVHYLDILAVGGGGGGGQGLTDSGGGGGGGGSGGYSYIKRAKVTPGDVLTITVGNGGNVSNLGYTKVFPVTLSYAWNAFMNNYAVWVSTDGVNPVGTQVYINRLWVAPYSGSYTLQLSADNSGTFEIDGTVIGTTSSFTSTDSFSFTAYQGNRAIKIKAVNDGGPAGIAAVILDSNGNVVWTTRTTLDPAAGQDGQNTTITGPFGTLAVAGGGAGSSATYTPPAPEYWGGTFDTGGGGWGGGDSGGNGGGDGGSGGSE